MLRRRTPPKRQLAQPLRVLDGALGRSANLLGDNFTVADLNVASILSWARPAQIDMSAVPESRRVAQELRRAPGRPRRAAIAARVRSEAIGAEKPLLRGNDCDGLGGAAIGGDAGSVGVDDQIVSGNGKPSLVVRIRQSET